MSIRDHLDISAYLVLGPENTGSRSVGEVVEQAVRAGFACIQVRSKVCDARQLIECAREAAQAIARAGKQESVALLIDDRLDVFLAAKMQGIKVDGVHVGQSDIPVDVCRAYVGEQGIVGLSARTQEMLSYVKTQDVSDVDYFGVGPLHETATKPDCGRIEDGSVVVKSLDELKELAQVSPRPLVVGGGVKKTDLANLKATGVDGFFVVSAVCAAESPFEAARELVQTWQKSMH